MDKKTLRIKAKEIRKKLDLTNISKNLALKLAETEEYKQAKNIMIYYPLENEVNLLSLLEDCSKKFYLPRINGKELECCPYSTGDELCDSCFHTKEPACRACNKTEIDLVIVPALGVDKDNYRLGYGGGFYDRFLKDYKGKTIVCIPQELVFDTVYPEKHDIKIDVVVS
jgi:5-formyltetrahydrofolate cyclo-ligase